MEVWTRTDQKNTMFVRHNGRLWIEFIDGKIVATLFELSRSKAGAVNLKNDKQASGAKHNFVVLNSQAAFEGPNETSLKKYATGTFNNISNTIKSILKHLKISLF